MADPVLVPPSQVDLLRSDRTLIDRWFEPSWASMNDHDSEDADWVRIYGPLGSTAWFFDDSRWLLDENAVRITKLTPDPLEINIASDFVLGDQKNGQYVLTGSDWSGVLFKHVETHWYNDPAVTAALGTIGTVLVGALSAAIAPLTGGAGTAIVGAVGGAGVGWAVGILKNGETDHSDNNRVDNLSSMFWGATPLPQNSALTTARMERRFASARETGGHGSAVEERLR